MNDLRVCVDLPAWAVEREHSAVDLTSDEDRMRLAIELARLNVETGSGGPFGAVIVESERGRVVAVGVNSVVRLRNSVLHAETVAFMRAQFRLRTHSLAAPGVPSCTLYASCDPCAMCLGATLWSGVTRLVCGAAREDALALGFEEGPVFPDSWTYLERRGVSVTRGVLRDPSRAVLREYQRRGGVVYNR